jgi:hypothetical protein
MTTLIFAGASDDAALLELFHHSPPLNKIWMFSVFGLNFPF